MPQPWLLDVNVPVDVSKLLAEFGIEAQHAASRGWDALTNRYAVPSFYSDSGWLGKRIPSDRFRVNCLAGPFDAPDVDVPMDSGLRTFTWP